MQEIGGIHTRGFGRFRLDLEEIGLRKKLLASLKRHPIDGKMR